MLNLIQEMFLRRKRRNTLRVVLVVIADHGQRAHLLPIPLSNDSWTDGKHAATIHHEATGKCGGNKEQSLHRIY
jgi:hypothetical protein